MKPPKGTSAGRNGSSGVLIMSLSVIVPEKSRGNKKCDKGDKEKEEEERYIFGLFGITVKWPRHGCMQVFWYLYVHSVEDSTLMPIFDQFCFYFVFFWSCQKSALIARLKTPSRSISFNSWLRCYRIV